jgi:hypothetical protein
MNVDDAHSGWPFIVTYIEVEEQINQHIQNNKRISIDKTVSETSMMN